MTAKCNKCGLHWKVSIKQKIPKQGYLCPFCTSKYSKGENQNEMVRRKSRTA